MTADTSSRRWLPIALSALVVVVIAALVVVVLTDDDEDVSTATTTSTSSSTSSTPATGSSTTPTTSTSTSASTTTTLVPTDAEGAIWPTAASGRRFTDPVAAATSFATDFVGFTDPVVGEFQQGDSRSGEVGVRPKTTGPVTTVLVRQLGSDGSWSVIGTSTANIEVDEPTTRSTIANPVHLAGRASAFEGNVSVEVREDDSADALAVGNVTGRGDGVLGPFSSDLDYSPPHTERGSVLFITYSAENGQVWEVAAIRVTFPTA